MYRTKAQSIKALAANTVVENLQRYFVNQLNGIDNAQLNNDSFEPIEWFRDEGVHGGGVRYVARKEQIFNRASVNVSQIHYDDVQEKDLASATAISTIIHPKNPYAPSVHMHISRTEMKNGKGYWRMMADLNPAIENQEVTVLFANVLKSVALKQYELGSAQGNRYFYIPALERHRGVSHFYLEEYNSGDVQADFNLATNLGKAVIDCYIKILKQAISTHPTLTYEDHKQQLAYHTLYLFQVLTLDRGTTSGLLVHDQNDIGIMGSLPAVVDRNLLASWVDKLQSPQDQLLESILDVLPSQSPCKIDEKVKLQLASIVRKHYKLYPMALTMQAQGDVIPTTVGNHK